MSVVIPLLPQNNPFPLFPLKRCIIPSLLAATCRSLFPIASLWHKDCWTDFFVATQYLLYAVHNKGIHWSSRCPIPLYNTKISSYLRGSINITTSLAAISPSVPITSCHFIAEIFCACQ